MSIRRLQYHIDYVHIITFKDEYKPIVAPYFGFDKVEYAIDNENTIHERIRIIFKNENIAFFLRKEGLVLLFEGEVEELKNQNGIIKPFWDLYEKIKLFKGYTKTTRHNLIVHAVDIREKDEINKLLENPSYFTQNPFGKLDDFSCVYDFKKEDIDFKLQFGNYSERDIKLHDLRPFNTSSTEDLLKNVGLMGRLELTEAEKSPTHSKFRSLLTKAEKVLTSFKLIKDEK